MSKNNTSISSHIFNIDHAAKYGVNESILIHHLIYWIEYNQRLKRNYIENRTWMFQTQKEMCAHFPYWTEDQIYKILKKLEKKKIIIKGNFNKSTYDRTIWYAFVNEDLFLKTLPFAIPSFDGMDSAEQRNGFHQTTEPIPNNKTNKNEEEEGQERGGVKFTPPEKIKKIVPETGFPPTESDLPNTSRQSQNQKTPQRAPAPPKMSKEDRDYYNKIKSNELLMWLPDGDKMEAILCYGWEIVQTVLNSLFDKHLSLREKVMPKKIKNMVGVFYAELNKEERRRNQW